MPDYVSDALYSLRIAKIPTKAASYRTHPLGRYCEDMRKYAARVADYELYAFDVSAINAATDLRIDTPDRVDRLVEAVLRSPRRILIEAQSNHIDLINSGLRGFLDSETSLRRNSETRWAALIDILGDGKATFQTISLLPRAEAKSDPIVADNLDFLRSLKGSLPETVLTSLSLRPSRDQGSIDIARHIGMSKAEFDAGFARIQGEHDPIVRRAVRLLAEDPGPRRRGQILDAAWRATRFRDMIRLRPAAVSAPTHPSARSAPPDERAHALDALRDGLPIIAMLAVLQADASDLAAEPRRRGSRSKKGAPSVTPKARDFAPGLKVVTLNLEDRDLQKMYDGSGIPSDRVSGSTDPHSRIRHPVRGHLFIARNGKMTWRRPHWRGSLEVPTLKRVVAPSHNR